MDEPKSNWQEWSMGEIIGLMAGMALWPLPAEHLYLSVVPPPKAGEQVGWLLLAILLFGTAIFAGDWWLVRFLNRRRSVKLHYAATCGLAVSIVQVVLMALLLFLHALGDLHRMHR